MADNFVLFYAMTALVILLIGLSKGGLGGALGGIATPLMALVMPADQVIGLLLPVLMITDIFAVASHWGHWEGRLLWLLVPASLIGIGAGTFFITGVSEEGLRQGLGVIVLLFALYKIGVEPRLKGWTYLPRPWHGVVAGSVAGFTSTVAHIGGPPIAIYLLMQTMTPRAFVATNALFFAIINWLKVPSYAYAGLFDPAQLLRIVWLLPLIPVGVWIGKWSSTRINKVVFERLIIGLLVMTSFLLFL
ncbi:MAG: sulfite exporter TauE/SafE family protein [Caldilineaceae bacterium]|nr:sulfite exporter TauE/SafE family protein [Caldilineaceae bacterium]MBP8107796.1 sulfite exporter TauE/SafE family protein [Caldilineaceae bacterium]MBP8121621.1 sulfite exporter TauE/SafE family protein [Caldilineaceae bacterium]MBP9073113.1 sulfite exporter TauE/SafE family protein [Caldilineaceae bacterium]